MKILGGEEIIDLQHLPPNLRAEMEDRFGTGFCEVKLAKSWLPLRISALAFTRGRLIHVVPGLNEEAEREILAHELTHVIQQRYGMTSAYSGLCDDPDLEQEARELGQLAVRGRRVRVGTPRRVPATGRSPVWQCIKTQFAGIPGSRLLQILDQEVESVVSSAKGIGKRSDNTYRLQNGWTWLSAAGKLAVSNSGYSQKNTWVPCTLVVGPEGTNVQVTGSASKPFSERLEFPNEKGKQDLNYQEIAQRIQTLGINERDQAGGILWRMTGQWHPATASKAAFLNSMVALLFGLEASRNKATLATTLMMLDLVQSGKHYGRQGDKTFTLSRAFNSGHLYAWDDGEEVSRESKGKFATGRLYGGKHPMAVHGTGTGNLKARYQMTNATETNEGNQAKLELNTLNQRHAVPRREISLLVHWLEATLFPEVGFQPDEMFVRRKIHDRLNQAYFQENPTWHLPQEPRRDTGEHREMTYEIGDQVFYVVDRSGRAVGQNFHAQSTCKLIPNNINNVTLGADISSPVVARMGKCPHCWNKVFEGWARQLDEGGPL